MSASASTLCGRQGALVSVSIGVDPRHLESLLESLALVSFPINPQIYHDAGMVYRFADGHQEVESITLVEFPAYKNQLDEVSAAVRAFGFDENSLQVTGMLDEIQAQNTWERAPQDAPYVERYRVKRRTAAS